MFIDWGILHLPCEHGPSRKTFRCRKRTLGSPVALQLRIGANEIHLVVILGADGVLDAASRFVNVQIGRNFLVRHFLRDTDSGRRCAIFYPG
jgi:hypothetical protein